MESLLVLLMLVGAEKNPGQAWLGGKVVNLDKDYINKPKFGKYAAQEVGHNLGLHHAKLSDVNNTKKDKIDKFGINTNNSNPVNNLKKSNVMRYTGDQNTEKGSKGNGANLREFWEDFRGRLSGAAVIPFSYDFW